MGFKCPICFEDFGVDRSKLAPHVKDKHGKESLEIMNSFISIAEGRGESLAEDVLPTSDVEEKATL